MLTLGVDLEDDSLKHMSMRVAKMYVNETFSGLNPLNEPAITLFDRKSELLQLLNSKWG